MERKKEELLLGEEMVGRKVVWIWTLVRDLAWMDLFAVRKGDVD